MTLVSLVSIFSAHASPIPMTAKDVVALIIDKASTIDTNPTANAKEIESLVDFNQLTLGALGDRASQASSSQKQTLSELLRKIITKTVYPEAPKFFKDVTIQYTNQTTTNGVQHVTSRVTKGTQHSTVEFWLKPEANTLRVVDLAIDGERWIENVHDQFNEIIGKQGVNGLIHRMEKRLAELNAKPKIAAL